MSAQVAIGYGHCVDLVYLRQHPETIDRLIEHQRIRVTTIATGPICTTQRLTLDDGTDLFAKQLTSGLHPMNSGAGADFFLTEAKGLRWLAEPGAVPIPEVIAASSQRLVLRWVEPGAPSVEAAREVGRGLAGLHAAGAPTFGGPWPGYIGSLPLDNGALNSWAEFYIERRIRPYVRYGVDTGLIDDGELRSLESAMARIPDRAGPAEAPARIHGDLWTGNVLYSAAGPGWLVDPAAHGGHRETDLASLALFGADFVDEIIAAYHEVSPLADGWRDRVPMHQLHLLLVNCVLFGRRFVPQTVAAALQV